MNGSLKVFRAGTRNSRLALWQTARVLEILRKFLPEHEFQTVEITAPGDADRTTDLRESPADFFTRTLDEALLAGKIDFAVHSAKDLPEPVPEGIDWFWLPDPGDRRDVLVGSLNPKVIGVSSDRRAAYAAKRFPFAKQYPVRGNIEERIQQLDAGKFDLLIMAGVALQRLGLEDRITEWIPLDQLETSESQGALAVTFRKNDPRLCAIRSLFVKSATFVGAGVCAGHCTLDGLHALRTAEVCLYDALMDESLLHHLPETARKVYVGKRLGAHSQSQDEINRLLCDYVRKGLRTVRLKGGDAGIFGRLAEEMDALEALGLAGRVLPGISAMQTAAAHTGILLTRRGVARGFSVMTPRLQGGGIGPVTKAARAELPVVFYMAAGTAEKLAQEMIADGVPPAMPCALVFGAGSEKEAVFRSTLGNLPAVDEVTGRLPGLFIVGEIARYGFDRSLGALGGQRVLLTCSEALMEKAVQAVNDSGGRPVARPLIRLKVSTDGLDAVRHLASYDWIALTSPSAVRCFHELLLKEKIDLRRIPKIMSVGSGSLWALRRIGLGCDLMPESDFSGAGLLADAVPVVKGQKILRLRSQNAGTELADGLRAAGAEVTDCVLYTNKPVHYPEMPEFDSVYFASASAVESFIEQWGAAVLKNKIILAIGGPTQAALKSFGLNAGVIGEMATVEESLRALAVYEINRRITHVS
ncbi:MAG TPA: uroporphyrinogen-III synthase [Pontiellaceae bacterium]|nr:uroporphyrinogen-III synthase [Pontiellaceae bacterium]